MKYRKATDWKGCKCGCHALLVAVFNSTALVTRQGGSIRIYDLDLEWMRVERMIAEMQAFMEGRI